MSNVAAFYAVRVHKRGSSIHAAPETILIASPDSDEYLLSAEEGLGIFELDELASGRERQEFMPIVRRLDGHFPNRFGVRSEDKQAIQEGSRKWAAFRLGEP